MAVSVNICVELILTLTMYKLTLALKLINGQINQVQANKWECIGKFLAFIFFIGFVIFDAVFMIQYKKSSSEF